MRKFVACFTLLLSINAFAQESQGCLSGIAAFSAGNYAKAVEIFTPLAQAGDACAQNRLGDIYRLGIGIKADKVTALALYEAAAAQGNREALMQAEMLKSSTK